VASLSSPSPLKGGGEEASVGAILALAYPDRVAKNRGSGAGGFVLANGRGGQVDAASNLARELFLVVAELTGAAAFSRIVLAAAITLAEIEEHFTDKIEDRDAVTYDTGSASLRARRSRRLGSVVLAEQVKQVTPDADTARILAQGLVGLGI
jgi:ATP-dependent helicase HrpB